jgi:hypothetical protein
MLPYRTGLAGHLVEKIRHVAIPGVSTLSLYQKVCQEITRKNAPTWCVKNRLQAGFGARMLKKWYPAESWGII